MNYRTPVPDRRGLSAIRYRPKIRGDQRAGCSEIFLRWDRPSIDLIGCILNRA